MELKSITREKPPNSYMSKNLQPTTKRLTGQYWVPVMIVNEHNNTLVGSSSNTPKGQVGGAVGSGAGGTKDEDA